MEAFADVLKTKAHLKKGKLIIFTESKETAEYLAAQIAKEVEPKVSFSPASRTRASAPKSL